MFAITLRTTSLDRFRDAIADRGTRDIRFEQASKLEKDLFVYPANICRMTFLVSGYKSGYMWNRMPTDFPARAWTAILTRSKIYE